MLRQGMLIPDEFNEHINILVSQSPITFSVLDSYLVTAARGLNPAPPLSQVQQQAAVTPELVLGAQAGGTTQTVGVTQPGATIPLGGSGTLTTTKTGGA